MKMIKLAFCAAGVLMTAVSAVCGAFFSTSSPSKAKYPVLGVDVSHYQGDVNWQTIQDQGIKFAFIKATEGSSHVDESVRNNLENITATDLKRSCYHFFSFDSPGETQAENFISNVGKDEIDMPPVVDIEYYADKSLNKPSLEEAEAILTPLLQKLEEHYGVKPIIYTTLPVYARYVRENYSDYPLWIRCTQLEPDLMNWQFWQFSDQGRLEGYNGDEPCIDLNVYCGSEEDFYKQYETT